VNSADLGLIDIAALDDEDGGLDDNRDTTKFPRPAAHQSRADQASEQWRRAREADALDDFDKQRVAASTRAKYESNWQAFGGWCHTKGIDPYEAEPDDVRYWILDLTRAGYRVPTIEGRLAAVRWHFDEVGRPSPTSTSDVAKTLEAAKRQIGDAKRRARPLMLDDLRRIVAAMPTVLNKPPDHLRVLRDRALLTLGWAAALRVSEIVALNIDDISTYGDPNTGTGGGALVRIRQSKTDQTRTGADIGVRYATHFNSCPVRATMAYTRKLMHVTNRDHVTGRRLPTQTNTGPLFRSIHRSGRVMGRLSRQSVDGLVAFYVEHALLDDPSPYSTHSLRSGFVTECSNHGVPENKIRRTTRHTSSAGLDPYDRPTEHFEHSALAGEWW